MFANKENKRTELDRCLTLMKTKPTPSFLKKTMEDNFFTRVNQLNSGLQGLSLQNAE